MPSRHHDDIELRRIREVMLGCESKAISAAKWRPPASDGYDLGVISAPARCAENIKGPDEIKFVDTVEHEDPYRY